MKNYLKYVGIKSRYDLQRFFKNHRGYKIVVNKYEKIDKENSFVDITFGLKRKER